jgi:predicted metal-binding membrane protein
MGSTPTMSLAMTALMTVAMMVAMMLPSFAPTLWRFHRHLHAMRTPHAGERTTLFAVGYAGVWIVLALALFALNIELPPTTLAPWAGPVLLCVGALQRSRWKAERLLRCRDGCAPVPPANVAAHWRDGCRFGVECGLSCAALMTVLLIARLMDARMMAVITAAVTAERVAPDGIRVARCSGAVALVVGLLMCL